jgi:hypothetical protein
MNRLRLLDLDAPEELPEADEFFVLYGEFGTFFLARDAAVRLDALLDGPSIPRWLVFTDLSGSRIRVLGRHVTGLYESTAAQRAAEREFHRARRLEDKADARPWDDE